MNEDLDITLADLTITKNAENCILRVYPDPASPLAVALQARNLWSTVLAGGAIPPELTDRSGAPWTGGWGHTGPDVIQGMIVTQEIADAWLLSDAHRSAANVKRVVTVPLTKEEFIALVDLDFNIGNHNFDTSTLLRKLNAGDIDGAVAEFARWNQAGGRVLAGLVKRRDGEKVLFLVGASHAKTQTSGDL